MQSSSRHLGSKPVFWVVDSTGHSLRQSQVLMMMMMVVVVVEVLVMIMFLTYDSFILLLDTEGDKKVNVARIILERIHQLTSRDYAQQHGS
jgi:Tfp pilus assembly protein PilE